MSKAPNNNEFPTVSWSDSPEGEEGREILPQVKGYEIVKKLGDGGMGVVYLAEQKEPIKRQVALKIIKPGMDSAKVVARFEAERQTLALLDHHNIARVFEAGTTQLGRPYFAMEYVKGIRITDYCDLRRLNIEERLDLFMQVCHAIQHAHQKGFIHRDIKPSNILISTEDDQAIPKIIDFGVAKALNQQLTECSMFTEEGQLVGTPEYMSPEQADLVNQDIDTRSDVYSLGVLLYELLTGTMPFDREALRKAAFGEIQRIIREEEPPRPSTKLSSLGDEATEIVQNRQTELPSLIKLLYNELEWIPLKAMRKERSHRYQSASEFADDVKNYMIGSPLVAGPESVVYKIKKYVRRNRILVSGVVAVLVVLIGGIVVSYIFAIGQTRARKEAEQARVNTFYSRGITYYTRGRYDLSISEYTKAIEINPKLAEVYHHRGICYHDKGEYNRAILDFTRAIKIDSEYTAAYYHRGNAYYKIGQYDMSISDLNKYIEMNPGHAGAYCNRGLNYAHKAKYNLAISDFTEAIKINSKYAGAYYNRGLAYSMKAEYNQAISDYSKAIEINPRYDEAYNNRGLIYNKKGEYEKAISDFSKALEINPALTQAQNNLKYAYNTKDKTGKSNSNIISRDAGAYYNYGSSYMKRGEYDQSIFYFNKAIETNPRHEGAYNNRGIAYYYKNEYDRAISDYNKALEINSKLAEAYNNRGLAYNAKNQCELAILDFTKAIEIKPRYYEAYNYRGLAYYNKGECERAILDYNKALELNTKYAYAYYNRAVAYYHKGEYDKAREDANKARNLGHEFSLEFFEDLREPSEKD